MPESILLPALDPETGSLLRPEDIAFFESCTEGHAGYFYRVLGHLYQFIEQGVSEGRSIMAGNDPVCDAAGARDAGLDVLYVHSNLSPAGPLPEATFVLPEMDISRMGAILAGEVQPA